MYKKNLKVWLMQFFGKYMENDNDIAEYILPVVDDILLRIKMRRITDLF